MAGSEHDPTPQPTRQPGGSDNTRLKTIVAVCVLVVALAASVYSFMLVQREEQRKRELAQAAPTEGEGAIPEPVGAEDAKIKVCVVLGHCFRPMMKSFVTMGEAWPDKVRCEFHAYESAEGQKIVTGHGERLACILIDDENRFTIEQDGQEREVHFHGPPGDGYRMAEIIEVLRVKMVDLYGEAPADFAEVTQPLIGDEGMKAAQGTVGSTGSQ